MQTNVRKHFTGKSTNPYSPIYKTKIETVAHIMCYQDPDATVMRNVAADKLEDGLVNAGTHPDIVTILYLAAKGDHTPTVMDPKKMKI